MKDEFAAYREEILPLIADNLKDIYITPIILDDIMDVVKDAYQAGYSHGVEQGYYEGLDENLTQLQW